MLRLKISVIELNRLAGSEAPPSAQHPIGIGRFSI
jgi:hypothetical protein